MSLCIDVDRPGPYSPPSPVYPNWAEMLRLGFDAITRHDLAAGTVLELFMPETLRPTVFTPVEMLKWLDADPAAACRAIRNTGGWARMPETTLEAIELLNPLGCTQYEHGEHFLKFAHAELSSGCSEWRIASCCDCGHPFIDYYHECADLQLQWPFYEDLR